MRPSNVYCALPSSPPTAGQIVAAMYDDKWYRARIVAVLNKGTYSETPAMDTPLVWTPRLSGRLPSDSFDFPIGAHSKRASVKWTPRVYGQWTKIAAPMYYRI